MDIAQRRHFIRLVYRSTFRNLAPVLVLCTLVGGLRDGSFYLVYALCAAGALLAAWGWLTYLRMTGMRLPGLKPDWEQRRVPFIHRSNIGSRMAGPSFSRDYRDFDDDLVAATAVDARAFSRRQTDIAQIISRVAAGGLLILFSFFV